MLEKYLSIFTFESEALRIKVSADLNKLFQHEQSREIITKILDPHRGKSYRIVLRLNNLWEARCNKSKNKYKINCNYDNEEWVLCVDQYKKYSLMILPTYVALAHELIHVLHASHEEGFDLATKTPWRNGYERIREYDTLLFSTIEERRTIGLADSMPYPVRDGMDSPVDFTENALRRCLGLPLRVGHIGFRNNNYDKTLRIFIMSILAHTPLSEIEILKLGYTQLQRSSDGFAFILELAIAGNNWGLCEICFSNSEYFLRSLSRSGQVGSITSIIENNDDTFIQNFRQNLEQYLIQPHTDQITRSFATGLLQELKPATPFFRARGFRFEREIFNTTPQQALERFMQRVQTSSQSHFFNSNKCVRSLVESRASVFLEQDHSETALTKAINSESILPLLQSCM